MKKRTSYFEKEHLWKKKEVWFKNMIKEMKEVLENKGEKSQRM